MRTFFSLTSFTPTPMMLCFSDGSGKTATGTICIEVPDANDYCPVIFSERRTICIDSPSVRIYVSDQSFGSPFTFCIVEESSETTNVWDLRPINGECNANLLTPEARKQNNY
jgi:desmoglein 4